MTSSEELVLQHQQFVRALARKIAAKLPSNVPFDELLGFGQLGLVEAANRFEPNRGVSFTTFAYYRIRGAIFDGLRKMTWLPPAARQGIAAEAGANDLLDANAGESDASDDPAFLAGRMSANVERLGAVYLLSNTAEGSSGLEPIEESDVVERADRREMVNRLARAMDELPPEQAAIIRMYYFEGRSMTECAETLSKDKSTISRRHADAIERIRKLVCDSE